MTAACAAANRRDNEGKTMPKAFGIEHADGTVSAIYVHGDGCIESAIETAASNYTTPAAVEKLIALGNLSLVGREIGQPHDFDSAHGSLELHPPEWCLAYGRDRGEPDQAAVTFANRDEFRR